MKFSPASHRRGTGSADNGDSELIVLDVVDHAIVTDSHPAKRIALQAVSESRWGVVFFQAADRGQYPTPNWPIKLADLLRRGGRELNAVCGHAPSSSRSSDNEIRSPLRVSPIRSCPNATRPTIEDNSVRSSRALTGELRLSMNHV